MAWIEKKPWCHRGLLAFRLVAFGLVFATLALTLAVGCRFQQFSCMHRRVAEEPLRSFFQGFAALSISGFCTAAFAVLGRVLCNLASCYTIEVFHRERLDWIRRPGPHPVVVPNHICMLEARQPWGPWPTCGEAFHLQTLLWVMSGCVAKAQLAIPGITSATRFVNGAPSQDGPME